MSMVQRFATRTYQAQLDNDPELETVTEQISWSESDENGQVGAGERVTITGQQVDGFTPGQPPPQVDIASAPQVASIHLDVMPQIDPTRVTINGGTAVDLAQQLAFLWQNGGEGGKAAVRALITEINNGGDTVNLNYNGSGGYMQAGPGLLNLPAAGIPSDRDGQLRWMMSLVHEVNHFTTDVHYSGTTYGEQRAYLAGYDFLADSLGLTSDEIRTVLGAGDPTYIIGTMVRVYSIDPGSNAFLTFMRNLGVGAGLGGLRDIAGSNQAGNSASPLDQTGDGLDADELLRIAQDIATPNADIRNLSDDPTSVTG
ncbi:MAG: hypothetical protein JNK82_33830 [Myxococcaceae bacterium]|nr:hypothetical protein [Myxococcaceae bacterium]